VTVARQVVVRRAPEPTAPDGAPDDRTNTDD
jgi:hypothetical protein